MARRSTPHRPPTGPGPTRYAHPAFTSSAPPDPVEPPPIGAEMAAFLAKNLGPIPAPGRDPSFTLAEVISDAGVAEIEALGAIRFHSVGDTGQPSGSKAQQAVAADMALDFHPDGGGANPAFFLHLGDVIYGHGKDNLYRDEFYRPYQNYPGKIVAVPGNHDGETFPGTDPISLASWLANFAAPTAEVPPIASGAGIFRQTMTEPGVYWLMDAPFVQIIGLYSNIADGAGYLVGAGDDDSQTKWLAASLKKVKASRASAGRKALIVAVHHPPYSNGGHAGSPEVLAAIDAAADASGVMPDAIFSGHAHNYQRHTRRVSFQGRPVEVPFVVAGCGGHDALPVSEAYGQVIGDHTFEKSRKGYGYLVVRVTPTTLTVDMWAVPSAANTPFDTVTVDLASNRLVPGTSA